MLVLMVPGHAMAQPSASCVENEDDGYTCTVVANGQAEALPFNVSTGDSDNGYLIYCAYGSNEDTQCIPGNADYWAIVVGFTNEPDTLVAAYLNSEPGVTSATFSGSDGFSVATETVADSSCDQYDVCPGMALSTGGAIFQYGDDELIIELPGIPPSPPTTNPCNAGLYCYTAAILWNAPAGTVITQLSTGDSPNISWTMPSSGTYTSLAIVNTTFSYSATLPGGSTITGTVTTPAAYGMVTVNIS